MNNLHAVQTEKSSSTMSKKWLWLFIPLIVLSILVVRGAFSSLPYISNIKGISMVPLVQDGDKAFMQSVGSKIVVGKIHAVSSFKTAYSKTGFSKNLIKRIIAGPGDTLVFHASSGEWLEINNQKVVVHPSGEHKDLVLTHQNSKYDLMAGYVEHLKNPIYRAAEQDLFDSGKIVFRYLQEHAGPDGKVAVRVPKDHYFVMSDNWIGNMDSRYYGPIHKSHLKYRAVAIISKEQLLD